MYTCIHILTYVHASIYMYTRTCTRAHTITRQTQCVCMTVYMHLMPATQVASSSIENRRLPPLPEIHTLVSLRGYTPSTGIAALSLVCGPCMFVTEMQGEQAPGLEIMGTDVCMVTDMVLESQGHAANMWVWMGSVRCRTTQYGVDPFSNHQNRTTR